MCFKCEEVKISRRQFLSASIKAAGAIALAGALPLEALAQDAKVEKVIENGPEELKYGIVFLPEGFTAKERKQFDAMVEKITTALKGTYHAYKEVFPWFNTSKIWVPSDGPYTGDGTGAFKVKKDSAQNPTEYDKEKVGAMVKLANADLPYIIQNDAASYGFTRQSCAIGTTVLEVSVHELGHAFSLGDEYAASSFAKAGIALNTSMDKENPPWKELIGKVKGIETKRIPGTDAYIGEEDGKCLMNDLDPAAQLGPLCTNGILLYLREKFAPIIQTATEEGTVKAVKGKETGIEAKVIPSLSHIPTARAWYISGETEKMDELSGKIKETFNPAKPDKEWKKMTAKYDKKTQTYKIMDRLKEGSHTVVLYVKDPNPTILLDPKKVTTAMKAYRVDVAEKK